MNRKQRRATVKAGGIVDVKMARLCDEAIRFLQAGALFLADEVLLLLRKDALFDFCSSVFVDTGAPTIFGDFIGEIMGGAMGKTPAHLGNMG